MAFLKEIAERVLAVLENIFHITYIFEQIKIADKTKNDDIS